MLAEADEAETQAETETVKRLTRRLTRTRRLRLVTVTEAETKTQ